MLICAGHNFASLQATAAFTTNLNLSSLLQLHYRPGRDQSLRWPGECRPAVGAHLRPDGLPRATLQWTGTDGAVRRQEPHILQGIQSGVCLCATSASLTAATGPSVVGRTVEARLTVAR